MYSLQKARDLASKVAQMNPSMKDSACLVALPVINCPSGRLKIDEAETLVDGQVVKSTALSKSDLEIFPTKELQPFNSLRIAAKRVVSTQCVEVGGLYLAPVEKLESIMKELNEIKLKYDVALGTLSHQYDQILTNHQKGNPQVAHLIARHKMSLQSFLSGFGFRINPPLSVAPLFEDDADAIKTEATLSLWDEVAKEAQSHHKTSFAGKEKASQRAIGALRRLRSKMLGLSFLHDGIDRVVDKFDELLGTLPKTGYLEGGDFYKVAHFVLQISDAQRLRDQADGSDAITGLEVEEVEVDEVISQDTSEEPELIATTQPLMLETDGALADEDELIIPQVQQNAFEFSADAWGGF